MDDPDGPSWQERAQAEYDAEEPQQSTEGRGRGSRERSYYGDNFEENVRARHRREEAAEERRHCSHWPLHQCCFCDEREDKSYAGLIRHIASLHEVIDTLQKHLNGCPYNGMEWWLGDDDGE